MLRIQGPANLHRIVVLNPKGGSGKTTLAFNLAGYLAVNGRRVALIDMDPQGSSANWLGKRATELAPIHGVAAPATSADRSPRGTIDLPPDIEYAVIDAPAGVSGAALADYTVGSHAILVPVLPSEIDIHAASRLITDLLLVARVSRTNRRLGIIANRVKERTVAYKQLMMFLDRLSIAVVGVLRDSQNYVSVAREGVCIHELSPSQAGRDLEQWSHITAWLEDRLATPLTERDLAVPKARRRRPIVAGLRRWGIAAAAGLAAVALAISMWPRAEETPSVQAVASVTSADPGSSGGTSGAALDPAASQPVGDGHSLDSPGREAGTAAAIAQGPSAASTGSVARPATPSEGMTSGPGSRPDEPLNVRQAASEGEATSPADSKPDLLVAAAESPEPSSDRTDRWELRGVAQAEEDRAVLLTDPADSSSETATNTREVDGWLVKEAGRDFAVLVKEDREIRLRLNEETSGAN